MQELKRIFPNAVDEIQRGLQKIGNYRGFHGVTIDWHLISLEKDSFVGIITSTGPNSEADYTDERYWIKEQYCNTTGTAGTEAVTFSNKSNPIHITATNIAEAVGSSHNLSAGEYIIAFRIKDIQDPQQIRWVFNKSLSLTYYIATSKVFKYSGNTKIWEYNTGGITRSLSLDTNGNLYVAGDRASNKTIWKLNSVTGALLNSYDSGAASGMRGICNDNSSVFIGGSGATNYYELLCSDFSLIDSLTLNGTVTCIYQQPDADYLYIPGTTVYNIFPGKYQAGVLQWAYPLTSTSYDIAVRAGGNCYIASARCNGADSSNKSIWALDSSGAYLWGYDTGAATTKIVSNIDSNVYAIGTRDVNNNCLWAFNSSGTLLWAKAFGNLDNPTALCQYDSNKLIIGDITIAGVIRSAVVSTIDGSITQLLPSTFGNPNDFIVHKDV